MRLSLSPHFVCCLPFSSPPRRVNSLVRLLSSASPRTIAGSISTRFNWDQLPASTRRARQMKEGERGSGASGIERGGGEREGSKRVAKNRECSTRNNSRAPAIPTVLTHPFLFPFRLHRANEILHVYTHPPLVPEAFPRTNPR